MSSPPTQPDAEPSYQYELRIPKERIAVLVGSKGYMKRKIEAATSSTLTIDSTEGDIFVEGTDVVKLVVARDIVHSIGRGFNPDLALELLKPDYVFELINLHDYNKHRNHQLRMKGRIIGKNGRTRELIEQYTTCYVTVYGKTIAVIGEAEHAQIARQAIEMLLEGAPHATVYKWLEKKRKATISRELQGQSPEDAVKEEFKQYLD